MQKRILVLGIFACAFLYAAMAVIGRIAPLDAAIAAHLEGAFKRDGQYPGERFADEVRIWGSWSGADENEGILTIGPFPAPHGLRLAVGGYPLHSDIELFVQLDGTNQRRPIVLESDVGEKWRVIEINLPTEWFGHPMVLMAVDHATTIGGWIAISEPLCASVGGLNSTLLVSLAAWSVTGLLLASLWFAAAGVIRRYIHIDPVWTPLAAAAFVAVCGYMGFWIFFASPVAGKWYSCALLVTAWLWSFLTRDDALADREFSGVAKLLVIITLFYVALLHFFPSSREIYDLVANRFIVYLPNDNSLSYLASDRLLRGEPLKQVGVDWLSSDRPPLLTGWQLLTLPVTRLLHLDNRIATCMASIWLQALWVAGAYGFLRALRLPRWRACGWIAIMSLSGFFVLNTIYTWPKLSAAAFAGGAFGVCLLPGREARRSTDLPLGALFAALGLLSHGGAAFALLACGPWLLWRAAQERFRAQALAAGVFLVLMGSWMAYQHFYDPPGNRLVKWHLGGQIATDSRGTWETIRDAYRGQTWRTLATNRLANVRAQYRARWERLFNFSPASSQARRSEEFFVTLRALTWWLLGVPALLIAAWRHTRRAQIGPDLRAHKLLLYWALGTLLVWVSLMFIPGSAIVHQGSYAVLLTLFVLMSAWLEAAGRWWMAIVLSVQCATFATTWTGPNAVIRGPLSMLALAVVIVTGIALLKIVVDAFRSDKLNPWVER